MSKFEIGISYVTVMLFAIGLCKIYQKTLPKTTRLVTYKNILIILIVAAAQMFVSLSQYNSYKLVIAFAIMLVMFLIIYQENLKTAFIKTLIIFFIQTFLEFIFSYLLIISFSDIKTIDSFLILKSLFSIFVILNMVLLFYFNKFLKFIKNLVRILTQKKAKIINMILVLYLIYIIFIMFIYVINLSKEYYSNNILFIALTFTCVFYMIYNYSKMLQTEEKHKNLLEFMTKYEILLEKDKINRHDMLNNLIILNSYKDKNSKVFNKTIEEMIRQYSSIKINYENIGSLPSGIKGVLYYKFSEIENFKINLIFNCSKKVHKFLKEDNNREYNKCCKLIGIFLDNAIEAAKESKDKKIIIDIYLENNYINFYIENSIKNKVNISKINQKSFSTKGKNRGLGLFIANKIKKQSKKLDYTQKIDTNNNFVTLLKMKIN